MNTKKSWTRPTLTLLGKIADVTAAAPPANTQNSGGSACTPLSPACAFS